MQGEIDKLREHCKIDIQAVEEMKKKYEDDINALKAERDEAYKKIDKLEESMVTLDSSRYESNQKFE